MIAPSILSTNFATLKDSLNHLEQIGVKLLHFDVMDNHFVPNLTFGHQFIQDHLPFTHTDVDIHLMIQNPAHHIKAYILSGVKYISAHLEAFASHQEILETSALLRSHQILFGLAIKPKTPIEEIFTFLKDIDFVLVMSVEPGFSGQMFIPEVREKIKTLHHKRENEGLSFLIEVDGGVTIENMLSLKKNGVDILVMGNAFFHSVEPDKILEMERGSL